ncbi:MAG TPA: methionine synthase [Thermoplasmataceae archaeon]|nr:methionine synthase [Thermoplasmatales archaeon AK]HLH85941.1 methionine synthase [Thermoplasmataceae archaeon]
MQDKLFITQEIGSFRKPDYLSRKFHKIEGSSEFFDLAGKATLETLDVFKRSGLDNLGVGGEMFRWEMYEHLAEHIDGVKFYGMVRSFDNRYYKKGSVVSAIRRHDSAHMAELKFLLENSKGELKIPITGPYTMMDWSFNDFYRDRYDLAMAYASVIREEISDLLRVFRAKRPNEIMQVQIDEPAATTHPDEMDIVVDSVNGSLQGIAGIEPTIHVCYSRDYRMLYDVVPDLKVKGLNLEFANRDPLESGSGKEKRTGYQDLKYFASINESLQEKRFIGLGVTDVHIDFVEPVKLIEERIEEAVKLIGDPSLIRVNPDCGLRTRSREIGERKLKNMSEAVHNLRVKYS